MLTLNKATKKATKLQEWLPQNNPKFKKEDQNDSYN